MTDISVAHLVRAKNGVEPFRRFIASYVDHPAGVDHDLLIIYKGFAASSQAEDYRRLLKNLPHRELFVSDRGLDLRAYRLAARHFVYPYLCFLNSFSVLLADDWLQKMYSLARQPGVGIVGSTGSYESFYTNLHGVAEPAGFLSHRFRLSLNRLFFQPFPNPHIRTNAFVINRALMLSLWPPGLLSKTQAYYFENGRNSLTKKILRRNLRALITGKDGQAYDISQWPASRTFRLSFQENLLIADNQTVQFDHADASARASLSRKSWGKTSGDYSLNPLTSSALS